MVLVGDKAESPWNELPTTLAARSFQDPPSHFCLEGTGREKAQGLHALAHII
jgi:hypothetical protein